MSKKTLLLLSLAFGFIVVGSQVQAEELSITDNGAGSQNNVNISQNTSTEVSQSNSANINNQTETTANSGDNTVSGNSGDATIQTGDVTASETINNDNVNQSVVESTCCPTDSGTDVEVSGNGAGSQSDVSLNQSNTTTVNIDQTANISNSSDGTANSGGNRAEDNNGNVSIETGNIEAHQETSNKDINQSHVEVAVGTDEVTAKIAGNGVNSTNSIRLVRDNNQGIWVFNRADINNDIEWEANSGNNFAQGNLGDVFIRTGDVGLEIVVENEGINKSEVIIRCCEEAIITPPTPPVVPPVNPPQGGEQPPTNPPSNPPTITQVTQAAAAAGGAVGEVLAAAGEVLPISGDLWTLIITLISSFLFFLGLFLRLHPGRDPSIRKVRLYS